MRRVGFIAAGLLVAAGLAIALIPFARPGSIHSVTNAGGVTNLSENCSAPIASAWRTEHIDGGWFGYAPIGDNRPAFVSPLCRPSARDRLKLTGALWFGAALFALARPRRTPLGSLATT